MDNQANRDDADAAADALEPDEGNIALGSAIDGNEGPVEAQHFGPIFDILDQEFHLEDF